MAEFFSDVQLSHTAAEAIARGLYAVARCDGMHEREAGLIASFWIDAGASGNLSDLERGVAIAPSELAAALRTPAERELFVKTALLLTYADGKVSDPEQKTVRDFARALGVDEGAVERLDAGVKDFLLSHLSHLHNTDAVSLVAKKLKV